jgi:hypothetical protein
MGEPVLSDAQFTKSFILRPYTGFETDYTPAVPSQTPVQFSEGGEPLDPQAGKPGYDPRLVRGLGVPMGARVLIWLPIVFAQVGPTPISYVWRLTWRLRNVFDYRKSRIPFHYPKQGEGVPDAGSPRTVIPAAYHSIIVNQAEPAGVGVMTQNVRIEQFRPEPAAAGTDLLPLLPGGGPGILQQGLLDPAAFGPNTPFKPLYLPVEVAAVGDQLMIGALRDSGGNWDFAGIDLTFANLFGSASGRTFPDIGLYVETGTSS